MDLPDLPEDLSDDDLADLQDAVTGKSALAQIARGPDQLMQGPEFRPNEMGAPPLPPAPAKPPAPPMAAMPPAGATAPAGIDWAGLHAKMQASPMPTKQSGPDWAALGRNLGLARANDDIGRAADQGFGNIGPGKYRSDPGGHEGSTAMASLPLEMAKAQQSFEGDQLAQQATVAKSAASAAMNDPNSLQSQKARAGFQAFFQGVQLPPGFAEWSAADVAAHAKDPLQAALAYQARSLVTERSRKANEADAVLGAEATSIEAEKAALLADPHAKKFGLTREMVDGLDRKGLQALRGEIATKDGKAAKGPGVPRAPVKAGDYTTVPSDLRETVKAIVEGRAPAPAPGSRFGAQVLNYVTQIDPSFDATKYGAYKDVRDKLSKSDEVVALNTAYSHISRAKANIPDNFDTQSFNRIKQVLQTGSGADTLTPFETDVKIAADELAKAYGNNSEAGRSTVEHLLAPTQSKPQLVARLNEVEQLLAGKLGSYQHQFERAAPKGASFEVLSPENRAPQDGGEPTVTVTNKKTGQSKRLPKSRADALLAAPGGDAYEVR